METIQYQKIAQFVLDTGTYTLGIGYNGIDSATFFIDSIKHEFGIFDNEIKEFIDLLEELRIIDHVCYIKASEINSSLSGFAYDAEVSIPRLKDFIKNGTNKDFQESKPLTIRIKDIRLRASGYLLEINNGEKIISFKSKTKSEGLDKETKQFKILMLLWDYHWELKDGKVLKKGDFTSLENLKRGSKCPTIEATYQHIKRINNLFKKNNLSIEIKGENEKYRLIINK
jgi:hypothetical protein